MADNLATDTLQLAVAHVKSGTVDPSAGAGVAAPVGSIYLRDGAAGELWQKTAAPDTGWVLSGTVTRARTVVVAKSGGDTTTIDAGLTLAAALVPAPSVTDPATVLVFPGVYSEVPLTAVGFVSVVSTGGSAVTVIDATIATSPVFVGAINAEIEGFTLRGADGVGGVGLQHSGGTFFAARRIVVQDCTTGFLSTGASTNMTLVDCLAQRKIGETLTTGFAATAGGTLRGITIQALGIPGAALITQGIHADGASSVVSMQVITVVGCTDGLRAENTGMIQAFSGTVQGCTNGLRIAATSGILGLVTIQVSASTTWDLLIESATALYRGSLCSLRNDLISVGAAADYLSLHTSDIVGEDSSLTLIGEFAVGNEDRPRESAFGGGDSHVRNLTVLRNTNLEVGTWSDITTEMQSAVASTANAFPGAGAGNTMYVGGAVAFPNIKPIVTAAIALGAGALIWEFSNGAGWTAMNVMASDAIYPYDQHAQNVFSHTVTDQIRFGDMVGWAAQAVNGVNKFWVRVRVATAITTSPTLQQIKLGTNRTEINGDGVIEHFGSAELIRPLAWHQRMMDDLSGASPANGALTLSTNITITPIDNRYNNGVLDGLGGLFEVPANLDTSKPVSIHVNWIPKGTGGDVELEANVAQISIGDVLDGTIADTNVAAITTAPAVDTLVHTVLSFGVPDLTEGDLVAFSLFRDAQAGNADDTLAAAIDIVTVSLEGTFWR